MTRLVRFHEFLLDEGVRLAQTKQYADSYQTTHHYDIYDDNTNERLGHTTVEAPHKTDHVSVGWIGKGHRLADGGQNSIGPARMKDFWRKLARAHPDRNLAIGNRIGGMRRPVDKETGMRAAPVAHKNYWMNVNLNRLRGTP